jgi:carbon monoxide dehydrogenase subunit G
MKIQGQHTFEAAQELVWNALVDPQVLAKALPGFEDLQQVDDNRFEGVLDIWVGPVQGRFEGRVELFDLEPPAGYRLKVEGKGAPGFVEGEGHLRLEGEGTSSTVHYEIEVQVGGRIAGIGQRLLDSSARVITRQALEGLEQQIQGLLQAGLTGQAAAEVAPPSQSQFAARVAKGVLAEAGMPARSLVIGGVVIAAVAVFVLLRGC